VPGRRPDGAIPPTATGQSGRCGRTGVLAGWRPLRLHPAGQQRRRRLALGPSGLAARHRRAGRAGGSNRPAGAGPRPHGLLFARAGPPASGLGADAASTRACSADAEPAGSVGSGAARTGGLLLLAATARIAIGGPRAVAVVAVVSGGRDSSGLSDSANDGS